MCKYCENFEKLVIGVFREMKNAPTNNDYRV